MTLSRELETPPPQPEVNDPEWEAIAFPPGDLESEEPPLESYLHLQQLLLLLKCLDWLWQDRNDYFAAGNLTIYYSPKQVKTKDFRGPDFFLVLDTERKPRKSWVVWEEGGIYPHVIIELLSDSTARRDRDEKKTIYQNIFRTPEYFWFSPDSLELKGFCLLNGNYEPLQPNDRGHLWSHQLQLFLGIHDKKLRYFTPEGELVPTPEESARTEKLRRETAERRILENEEVIRTTQAQLETERQQKERLAARLRELGIDPDAM